MMRRLLAHLRGFFEQGQKVFHGADFLVVDENERFFEQAFHGLGIGDEIGRNIAAVELHAFDDFERRVDALRLFDGDDAVFADFFHGVGDKVADFMVVVRGNRGDLGDLFFAGNGLGLLFQVFDDGFYRFVDAALDRHGVCAGGDGLDALTGNDLGKHRCGRGSVAGDVGCLGGDFLDHLRAHVFELVFEFDFFCNGHAVFGDGGRAEAFVKHDVAAARAERCLYRVCKDVDTPEQFFPRRDIKC